jgi:hypothetical protein
MTTEPCTLPLGAYDFGIVLSSLAASPRALTADGGMHEPEHVRDGADALAG